MTEIIVAPDLVSREAIANACRHLADVDLVRWKPFTPVLEQYALGRQRLRAQELMSSPEVEGQLRRSFPRGGAACCADHPAAVKESERINLAEGLAVLANYLPAADAKVRLRDASFGRPSASGHALLFPMMKLRSNGRPAQLEFPEARAVYSDVF